MADIKRIFMKQGVQTLFLMGIRGTSLVSKFALTLFIARFMGFEVLGLYGLIVSATFLVPAFTGLGIMYIVGRNAVTQSSTKIVEMLHYYGRFISLIYIPLIAVALAIGYFQEEILLALAIILVILFEHVNNDFYNLFLNLSKPLAANILHFIRTAVWIIFFIGASFFVPSLQIMEALLAAWIFGSIISLLGFFWVTRHWSWRKVAPLASLKTWLKEEFQSSKTIYLNNMMDSSSHYLNNFLVTIFLGLELTGVYVFFMQIINALMNLLRTGIVQVACPKLVRAHKNLDASFVQLYKTCMKHTMLFSITMAVIAVPVMYFITLYVVDKPLAIEWFPVLLVNLVFFFVFMVTEVGQLVLYSHHRDDLTLKLSFLNVAGLLIFNMVLIPLFSLWGAAIVLLLMIIIKLLVQRRFIKMLVMDL